MIENGVYWIEILPSKRDSNAPDIAGKWLCFGPTEELHLYVELLNTLVEERTLRCAKIARKDPSIDPFPHKPCVICVFTSGEKDEIEKTREELVVIGLNPSQWKSELETHLDWETGGRLSQERAIVERKRVLAAGIGIPAGQPETTATVFLSASTKDLRYSNDVYALLVANGIRTFLAHRSLPEIGESDYQKAIDRALEDSQHMIVVASCRENVESPWVSAEWRMFLGELRSGRKKGNLVTVACGDLRIEDLPISLRAYQLLRLNNEEGIATLLKYVCTTQCSGKNLQCPD